MGFENDLKKEYEALLKKRNNVVRTGAISLQGDLVTNTPIDTGELRDSWQPPEKLGTLSWRIANIAPYAYIIDGNVRASDDDEPSKTARAPILNVLVQQHLNHILCVVIRYFGGIKLGAGGLTRAYSQAVADALKEANIVEKHLIDVYDVSLDYSFTKKFEHLLKVYDIDCINKEYDEQVTYRLYIDDLSFFDTIQDLTSNRYSKEFIKKEYVPVK